jgi:DNA polymerase-4
MIRDGWATASLAEIAHDLVRVILADHPAERSLSLLAISVSYLEEHGDMQLELPLGLEDEGRRPRYQKRQGALDRRPRCGHDP